MKNEIVKIEIVKELQEISNFSTSTNLLIGFEKAFAKANIIMKLKELLTPEIMKPFKLLMNNAIGFKTDRDKSENTYSDEVIKNCLIEAINYGVQITDNQFNIIAGRAYITKEGFRFLLKNVAGLKFAESRDGLPIWDSEKVVVNMIIDWEFQGEKNSQKMAFSFKIEKSQYGKITTTDDNTTGKATRKILKWLYEKVSGFEMPDGEIATENYSGLDPQKEIKNPLEAIQDPFEKAKIERPKITAEEILLNASLNMQDVIDYCSAESLELEIILERIIINPAGAIAKIKKFKES